MPGYVRKGAIDRCQRNCSNSSGPSSEADNRGAIIGPSYETGALQLPNKRSAETGPKPHCSKRWPNHHNLTKPCSGKPIFGP